MISVDFDKNHWIKVWNKASSECSLYNLSSLSRDSSFYLQVITLPVSIATGISGKPIICGLGGGGGNVTSWQPLAQVSSGKFLWLHSECVAARSEFPTCLSSAIACCTQEGWRGGGSAGGKGWGWDADSAGGRGWGWVGDWRERRWSNAWPPSWKAGKPVHRLASGGRGPPLLVHVLSRDFCYLGAHHAVSAIVAMLFTFHWARAFTFHLSGESARHCSGEFHSLDSFVRPLAL